ncbi:MAG: hypothetical protein HZB53_19735 [Chloroflexi bacterium]|nr:hypothetical protein [Chloroflexota bacterium]
MTTSARIERFVPSAFARIVAAVYPDRVAARRIVNDLRAFGLRGDQLGVAMRDGSQQARLLLDSGLPAAAGALNGLAVDPVHHGWRALMAGVRAMLSGGASTPRAVPSVPLVIPLPGGMIGALISLHVPEAAARLQEAGFRAGSVLITARVFEGVADAEGIMRRHGGDVVHSGQAKLTVGRTV